MKPVLDIVGLPLSRPAQKTGSTRTQLVCVPATFVLSRVSRSPSIKTDRGLRALPTALSASNPAIHLAQLPEL